MNLSVLTTEDEVTALAGAWQQLAEALPESTPYSRPSWVLPWWRQRHDMGLSWLCFITRGHGGRLTGVLPLVRYPSGTIRYAGHDLHDIAESLIAKDMSCAMWKEVLQWLCDNVSSCVIELGTLDPHDRECLRRIGSQVADTELDPGAAIDLPPTWEGHLSRLSANRRKQFRWERRALQREHGPVAFHVTTDTADLAADLDVLWELRERSWKQRGRYAELATHVRGQAIRDFLHELAVDAASDIYPAQVARLTAGSQLVAAELMLRSGRRIWTPMCAFDPGYARFGPGRLLMVDCVRYAIEHGCSSLELGRGIEQYKFDLGAIRYELTNSLVTVAA